MSDYVPKVGDIVNVTLRDAEVVVVQEAFGDYDVTVRGNDNGQKREFYVSRLGSPVTTVELVKAAERPKPKWPTTPGSVIGYKHIDSKYVRLDEGWKSVKWAGAPIYKDSDFAVGEYEVLFDAGAPR